MSHSDKVESCSFDLTGGKALVTGGASGIGRAAALALAHAGADVAISDLNMEEGNATAAAIRKIGRQSCFVLCDVTDEQQVATMVEHVVSVFGRLDIAINSAGIYRRGSDHEQTKADWDQVLDVNLTGTWLCARAQMKQMMRQQPVGGKIVNVASFAAIRAVSNGAYDASKAAVVHLTRTLAAQWGAYNINVNCISPGYVAAVFGKSRSEEERARIREVTPLGHVQRLADLSGPFVFLSSRASDYVTGENLTVDGGHSLKTWLYPATRVVLPRVDPLSEVSE